MIRSLFGFVVYCGTFHIESCLALCSLLSVLFSIVITSFGEERAGLCLTEHTSYKSPVTLFKRNLHGERFNTNNKKLHK